MRVRWQPMGLGQMLECARFIAADDHAASLRWIREVEDAVARVGEFPRAGRVVPEFGDDDLREVLCGEYRVIYEIAEVIEVVSVVHGRRLLRRADLDTSG